jgi:hypothetical protein
MKKFAATLAVACVGIGAFGGTTAGAASVTSDQAACTS